MEKQIKLETKKPDNLMHKAYDVIKANICSNTIEQGALLSESQIAKELGMSRTPVREALKALAIEGMVEIHLGIGAYVKPISYKEFRDLYEVRKALEVVAARTALKNISERDVKELEDQFNDLLSAYKEGTAISLQEFIDIDLALHEMLIKKCDNDYVKSFMGRIMENVRRVQTMSFESLNDLEESTRQHLHLLKLIKEGDIEVLARAIEEHVDWSAGCVDLF